MAAGAASTFGAAVLRAGLAGMAGMAAAALRGAALLALLRGRLATTALTGVVAGAGADAGADAGAGESAANGLVGNSLGRVDEGMADPFKKEVNGLYSIHQFCVLQSIDASQQPCAGHLCRSCLRWLKNWNTTTLMSAPLGPAADVMFLTR